MPTIGQLVRDGREKQRRKNTAPALHAPVVTMVSYAIVFRHGLEAYVADARAVGVAGAIVPDLPVEEAGPLAEVCRREGARADHGTAAPGTARLEPRELRDVRAWMYHVTEIVEPRVPHDELHRRIGPRDRATIGRGPEVLATVHSFFWPIT